MNIKTKFLSKSSLASHRSIANGAILRSPTTNIILPRCRTGETLIFSIKENINQTEKQNKIKVKILKNGGIKGKHINYDISVSRF
jgi:hypothetical protein